MVGDSSGKTMLQKRRVGEAPSMAAASISERGSIAGRPGRTGSCTTPASHGRDQHQHHGLVAVQARVPVDAGVVQRDGQDADRGREHEQPQHADHGRRDGVGPDQQGLVEAGAADHAVRHDGKQQRHAQADHGHQHREHGGDAERVQVGLLLEQFDEVVDADELGRQAEGVFEPHGLPHGLSGGQEEEDHCDDDLRQQQQIGSVLCPNTTRFSIGEPRVQKSGDGRSPPEEPRA